MKEAETEVVEATEAGMAEGVGMATGAAVDTTDVKDIIPRPVEEDITTSLPTKEWEVATGNIYFLICYEAAKIRDFFTAREPSFLKGFLQTASFCQEYIFAKRKCKKSVFNLISEPSLLGNTGPHFYDLKVYFWWPNKRVFLVQIEFEHPVWMFCPVI